MLVLRTLLLVQNNKAFPGVFASVWHHNIIVLVLLLCLFKWNYLSETSHRMRIRLSYVKTSLVCDLSEAAGPNWFFTVLRFECSSAIIMSVPTQQHTTVINKDWFFFYLMLCDFHETQSCLWYNFMIWFLLSFLFYNGQLSYSHAKITSLVIFFFIVKFCDSCPGSNCPHTTQEYMRNRDSKCCIVGNWTFFS